jgi:hypothetical protein
MAIPSNSLPPARGYRVDHTLKQFFDRAETGVAGALPERHKTGKTSTNIANYR